jgi:hypothetical protein
LGTHLVITVENAVGDDLFFGANSIYHSATKAMNKIVYGTFAAVQSKSPFCRIVADDAALFSVTNVMTEFDTSATSSGTLEWQDRSAITVLPSGGLEVGATFHWDKCRRRRINEVLGDWSIGE